MLFRSLVLTAVFTSTFASSTQVINECEKGIDICFASGDDLSFKEENFFLKKGYRSRKSYHHYDARNSLDGSQDEVYALAKEIALKNELSIIADIGCGSAFKLIKHFSGYNTIGYEIEPTLSFLMDNYPSLTWKLSDLSSYPEIIDVDIIICADVIEHLVNPDNLLNFINRFNFKYLVISTPDRDQLLKKQGRKRSQTGPPINRGHVREWSFKELEEYLSQYFDIQTHEDCDAEYWCQVIVATKK